MKLYELNVGLKYESELTNNNDERFNRYSDHFHKFKDFPIGSFKKREIVLIIKRIENF